LKPLKSWEAVGLKLLSKRSAQWILFFGLATLSLMHISLQARAERQTLWSNYPNEIISEFFETSDAPKNIRRRQRDEEIALIGIQSASDLFSLLMNELRQGRTGPWPLWLNNAEVILNDPEVGRYLLPIDQWDLSKELKTQVQPYRRWVKERSLEKSCLPISLSGYGVLLNWSALRHRGEDFVSASRALNAETLTSTSFRDLLIIPDPTVDALSATIFASIIAERGILEGWRLIEGWFLNLKRIETDHIKATRSVLLGEGAATFTTDDMAYRLIARSGRQDLEFIPLSHPQFLKHDCFLMVGFDQSVRRPRSDLLRRLLTVAKQTLWFGPLGLRGGPQRTLLSRMAVNPSAYEQFRGRVSNPYNPHRPPQVGEDKLVPHVFKEQFIADLMRIIFLQYSESWKALGEQIKAVHPTVARKTDMFSRVFLPRETELLSFERVWHIDRYQKQLTTRLDAAVQKLFSKQNVGQPPRK
jgi:hypothetical protein